MIKGEEEHSWYYSLKGHGCMNLANRQGTDEKVNGLYLCSVRVHVGADGVAVEAGAAAAGAEVVVEEPELRWGGMSQTWPEGQENCRDKFDQAPAEGTGRRR